MNRLGISLILTTTCALAACRGEREQEPPVSDPARTVRARVGKEFQISVRDIPGTGYTWHLVDSASRAPLVLVDSAYWMSRANQQTDGGGGIRSWTFISPHAGSATVSLAHVPPGVPVDSPFSTARYHVVID